MPTYAPPPLTLVRGSGTTVWDSEGRAYDDLVAGIAVCVLGHAHPKVAEAVARQLLTLGHVSNLYRTEPAHMLAEKLAEIAGAPAKTFFCNSGAEAVEAALKLARRTGRTEVVAAEGSFHGRTLGALSLTGQPAKREPFEPLPGGVTFVPYGDADALRRAVTSETAAVFLEPIQGEAGVVAPPPGYLAAARAITAGKGALLVLDEVQTGVGRTGTWYAFQREGVLPDVVTLAKGLGGGLPIGACVGFGMAGDLFRPGDHGSTFGGNPVCCAAALAVVETVESEGLVERAKVAGERLAGSRGAGLLRAYDVADAKEAEVAARDAGFLVNAIGDHTIRLAPPLIVTDEVLDRFVAHVAG